MYHVTTIQNASCEGFSRGMMQKLACMNFSLRKHPNLPFHFAAELLKGIKIDADADPWMFGTMGDGEYGTC